MDTSPQSPKRDPVDKILQEFDQRKDSLKEFCARTKNLIEDCLEDCEVPYQSVQARVKDEKKLRTKYLDPHKDYARLDDITDLAALRIITYYEDDLDTVVEVIKREFAVIPEKSVDKREMEPDRFGYRGINLVCTHSKKRRKDVQFKKHADVVCEIQVTSVLGHAWSEIEHEWYDLKETYPTEIKRRFYRLAALIELAETEFVSLRDQRTNYTRSVGVRVEAAVPDTPIDAVSLKAFALQEPVVAALDKKISEIVKHPVIDKREDPSLVNKSKAANLVGLTTTRLLRDALEKYADYVPEFVKAAIPVWKDEATIGSITPGVCIAQLAVMLAARQGNDKLIELFTALGYNTAPTSLVVGLVKCAKDVLSGSRD